ncbi:MAG: PfkB family carbohydrate kinase [Desulfobacterales bacterium]
MVLVIGEVLFDVFPQYRRIGGAPFNFAYHLHHLGLPVRFVSRIGADAPGREVLAFFESCGLDAGDLQLDPTHATGQVQVSLDNDAVPTFDIRPNMAYDHIDVDRNLEKLLAAPPRLIYFGTLALPRASMSAKKASMLRSLTASIELPSAAARARILSSMSVKFCTNVTA